MKNINLLKIISIIFFIFCFVKELIIINYELIIIIAIFIIFSLLIKNIAPILIDFFNSYKEEIHNDYNHLITNSVDSLNLKINHFIKLIHKANILHSFTSTLTEDNFLINQTINTDSILDPYVVDLEMKILNSFVQQSNIINFEKLFHN